MGLGEFVLARALHVLGVVLWIGGVAFVTLVLLPGLRQYGAAGERMALFERLEGGFARQARATTLLTGLSGLWLVHQLHAWSRFADGRYWWMHAMVAVWLLFTLMLFVLEPWFLHRWFNARAAHDPVGTFRLLEGLHCFLLTVSLVTVAGAAAGSHGWMF
ncbi:MAG: hypothetical protein K2Y51_11155 [Gammaproteobacteria bacterium]|nr:hypothetical protein [Gammaproteobacteria bacterium]